MRVIRFEGFISFNSSLKGSSLDRSYLCRSLRCHPDLLPDLKMVSLVVSRSRTIGTQKLDFISDLLSKLLNSPQNCPKLHLEGGDGPLREAHRAICGIVLLGSNQIVDNLGVEPGGDGFKSLGIRTNTR